MEVGEALSCSSRSLRVRDFGFASTCGRVVSRGVWGQGFDYSNDVRTSTTLSPAGFDSAQPAVRLRNGKNRGRQKFQDSEIQKYKTNR